MFRKSGAAGADIRSEIQSEIESEIESCGVDPSLIELGIPRQKVKYFLAQLRAKANPRYAYRLSLPEPITRKVWVDWCNAVGVDSRLSHYSTSSIQMLVWACVWFARGGTKTELEAEIIRKEKEAAETDVHKNAA